MMLSYGGGRRYKFQTRRASGSESTSFLHVCCLESSERLRHSLIGCLFSYAGTMDTQNYHPRRRMCVLVFGC